MGPVWGAVVVVDVGREVGRVVGLDDGGGGGAVGPVCDLGVLLGLALRLGEADADGGRVGAGGGGGGRAVWLPAAPGVALLRVLPGVRPDDGGGGGGESTPSGRPDGDFPRPPPVGVWIAAGMPDPPPESGQASQMPAPATTRRVRPTTMGPRRSCPSLRRPGSSSSRSTEVSQVRHRSARGPPSVEFLAYGGRRRGEVGSSRLSGTRFASEGGRGDAVGLRAHREVRHYLCIHVGVKTARQSTEYRSLLCNKSDMRSLLFLPYISDCFASITFIICNYVRRAEPRAEEG